MTISNNEDADGWPEQILHIAERAEFERQNEAGDVIVDPSLGREGFIHCSTVDQVLIPANERFEGRSGLVLLIIEVARLTSPLVYEDCYQSGRMFPHVYGPINLDAVVELVNFPPRSDGGFDLPTELAAADR